MLIGEIQILGAFCTSMVAFLLFQPKTDITNGLYGGLNSGQSTARPQNLSQDPSTPVIPGAGDSDVSNALETAAQQTGAGFGYLLRTAMQESSMRPDAQAPTSSATGLFQFIESTWLRTVKTDGARFGLESFANNIEASSSGRYTVSDPQTRADILALRNDPKISALMAGALAEDNATALTNTLGRNPNDGELYIAHFLGARGAGQLIQMAENRPGANAANAFPDPARANKAIFYNRDGIPRSVGEVYRVLVQKHHAAEQPGRAALNTMRAPDTPEAPVQPSRPARFGSLFDGLFRAIVGGKALGESGAFRGSLYAEARVVNNQAGHSQNAAMTQTMSSTTPSVTSSSGLEISHTNTDANGAYQRHTDWMSVDSGKDDPASWI